MPGPYTLPGLTYRPPGVLTPGGPPQTGGGTTSVAVNYPRSISPFDLSTSPQGTSSYILISGGNGAANNSGNWAGILTKKGRNTGRWQIEGTIALGTGTANGGSAGFGLALSSWTPSHAIGYDAGSLGWSVGANANIYFYYNSGNGGSNNSPSYRVASVFGICVDLDAGLCWAMGDGAYFNGDPTKGTGGFPIPSGILYPAIGTGYYGDGSIVNRGQMPFYYPIAGFKPWEP